jgi:hypothetical protein
VNPPEHQAREDWADYLDPEQHDPALPAAERDALDSVAVRLKDEALWSGPSDRVRAALLAQVIAERDAGAGPDGMRSDQTSRPSTEPATGPATERGTGLRPRRAAQRARGRWLVAAAAVAAVVISGALLWPRSHPQTFSVAGTTLAPQASASVELTPKSAGVAIRLHIKGLKPAPPGTFYAAWLRGAPGVVPVGTFHWHKGGIPIDLWSGVTTDRYPELFVTLQTEGQPLGPSDRVVLDGRTS